MITLYNTYRDDVIRSCVSQGETSYRYALEELLPLINKFDEQRKLQGRKFYQRLRKDIVNGCIMPPITLAFVDKNHSNITNTVQIQKYVSENIAKGYVLDGIQRINTLNDASTDSKFSADGHLNLNVIIAERYDILLYRMITLNNGQKPMTVRHQIEMLSKGMLDTHQSNLTIFTEKEAGKAKPRGTFKNSDITEAYTAFLTDSVRNQNTRIIESKLDEIIVGKLMDSDLTNSTMSFHDILTLVERFIENPRSHDWFRFSNNLIGFSVGAKKSYEYIKTIDNNRFWTSVSLFESSFAALDFSKINRGKYRRELSRLFFAGIEKYIEYDSEELTDVFNENTLVD
jgi:hypothetical protein